MILRLTYKDCSIDILRLDTLHPPIGGNKYFKLKYNIEEADKQNLQTILTFGGAFSNHIFATALAGRLYNKNTIGVIRGEDDVQNPTLQFCKKQGMRLHFVSRDAYKEKTSERFLTDLKNRFGDFYLLHEGGTNAHAVKGTAEILLGIELNYERIFCAVGTGGTLAGILSTPDLRTRVIGISVLKGHDALTEKIASLILLKNTNWEINCNYHLGGYAKYNAELIRFINQFQYNYKIPLDPVYTGKVFFAVFDMIDKNVIKAEQKILVIHTGGMQGWQGWNYRYKNKSTS
jgi:1-aminocyclopropane-1-carboxylate deaminase